MRTPVPQFSNIMAPLKILLEDDYLSSGKGTKTAGDNFSFELLWNKPHEKEFSSIKSEFLNAAKLAHPDDKNAPFLFTDTSNMHWAEISTQIPAEHSKQRFI